MNTAIHYMATDDFGHVDDLIPHSTGPSLTAVPSIT